MSVGGLGVWEEPPHSLLGTSLPWCPISTRSYSRFPRPSFSVTCWLPQPSIGQRAGLQPSSSYHRVHVLPFNLKGSICHREMHCGVIRAHSLHGIQGLVISTWSDSILTTFYYWTMTQGSPCPPLVTDHSSPDTLKSLFIKKKKKKKNLVQQ